MDAEIVKWIGRIALVALVASGIWQAVLPALDARRGTRFSRELAAVRAEERRDVALGWSLRRWAVLTVAPLALMVAAAGGLGRLAAGSDGTFARLALPLLLAAFGIAWHLVTTFAAVRRIERTEGP